MPTLNRRKLIGCACCAGLAAQSSVGGFSSVLAATGHSKTDLSAQQALDVLKKGNENFVQDAPVNAAIGRERRLEIARGQTPFAVLVGCSDSRVSPEILFGRGLGDSLLCEMQAIRSTPRRSARLNMRSEISVCR